MKSPRLKFRRGLTMIELLIGLVITGLVMAALASITFAVAQGWTASDGTQNLQIQSQQVYTRVRYNLASALYIGLVNAGSLNGSATTPGCVVYWANDSVNADGKPEIGEMALIQHDAVNQVVTLYYCMPYASMTGTQQTSAAGSISYATMTTSTWPATFEALSFVKKTVLGRNVKGATFASYWNTSTTQRPLVEFCLVLNRPPQFSTTLYGVALLRSPMTQPL